MNAIIPTHASAHPCTIGMIGDVFCFEIYVCGVTSTPWRAGDHDKRQDDEEDRTITCKTCQCVMLSKLDAAWERAVMPFGEYYE